MFLKRPQNSPETLMLRCTTFSGAHLLRINCAPRRSRALPERLRQILRPLLVSLPGPYSLWNRDAAMRNQILAHVLVAALLLGVTVSLGGCGQKGDLYHPDKHQVSQH